MRVYQLNRVIRNSVEIHNLVKLTTETLHKQQTVFIHQEDKQMKNQLKTGVRNESVSATNTVTKSCSTGVQITAKLPSRQRDVSQYPEEELGLDGAKLDRKSVKGTRYRDEYPEENPRVSKLGLDEAQAVLGSVKGISDGGEKFRSEHYKKLGEKFSELITKNKNFGSKKELEARKIIQQR